MLTTAQTLGATSRTDHLWGWDRSGEGPSHLTPPRASGPRSTHALGGSRPSSDDRRPSVGPADTHPPLDQHPRSGFT